MIPDIVDFFNSISHKPIQFDSFLFVWMKIFHPSCQSLAFSAPSAYYYNKNPSRFLCRFAHRVQKGAHCHDHHGAKSRTAQSGHCGPRALSDTERTRSNAALCARIMALDCFKKAENILLYAAFGGEADLSALAVEAARQGKTLAYPVCGEGFSLTAAVPGPDGWEVGAYGIRTPILSRSKILRPDQLDLVLVPVRLLTPPAAASGWGKATTTATSPAAPGL